MDTISASLNYLEGEDYEGRIQIELEDYFKETFGKMPVHYNFYKGALIKRGRYYR